MIALAGAGCSRQHYRAKADGEAYGLLACTAKDPRWKLEDYRIDTDPRSRMFDRFDPDCEPMPPDDPAAQCKMRRVDGKKGSKHWDDCGCTHCVENPCWKQYLLFNERGAVSLNKDGAYELALLHSPAYQSALENLYLSALDVSQERFRFDVQFYGGDSMLYTAAGRLRDVSGTRLVNLADIEAEKLFATGGQLAVGLANTITWTFSGADTWRAESLFSASFVQPLLRNAGRKVVLEKLTQTERDFLAAVRQTVFFRQGYYTRIITGASDVAASGDTLKSPYTPSLNSGFYGLLAQQIRIENQRQNIVNLEDNLNRFIEYFKANQLRDRYQVEETRLRKLYSESSLLREIGQYESSVETFLRSLGLPPDLEVEIDDPLMEQFQLTSPSLTRLQEEAGRLLTRVRQSDEPLTDDFFDGLRKTVQKTEGEIQSLHNDLATLEASVSKRIESLDALRSLFMERIRRGERIDPSIYDTDLFRERVRQLKDEDVPANVAKLQASFVLIDAILRYDEPTLRKRLREQRLDPKVTEALGVLKLDEEALSLRWDDDFPGRLDELRATDQTLEELRRVLREEEAAERKAAASALVPKAPQRESDALDPAGPENATLRIDATLPVQKEKTEAQIIIEQLQQKDIYRSWLHRILSRFQNELVTLSIMQTRARLDSITLDPTRISAEEAFRIASENRLDWMNKRSELTDSWRQLDIAANSLKGELNVRVEGEIGTIDKHGVRFDGDRGEVRVGFEWKSPLTRHDEMLDYRRAQIAYQNARRNYYSYVDSVHAELRDILRNIRVDLVDFEIQRNAILVAAIQVDLTQLNLAEPPERGAKVNSEAARELLSALEGLLSRQNDFLDVWVAYQTQRMLLDLNMGTMQLDDRGRWVDPGTITKDRIGAPAMHGYGRRYAGAFAGESTLIPSKRRCRRSENNVASTAPPSNDRMFDAAAEQPVLPPPSEENGNPVFAPPIPVPLPKPPRIETPVEFDEHEKSVEPVEPNKLVLPPATEQDRKTPTGSTSKPDRKPAAPRTTVAPDMSSRTALRSSRTLKMSDAPPPPKTPE